jgi:hypothetical protein
MPLIRDHLAAEYGGLTAEQAGFAIDRLRASRKTFENLSIDPHRLCTEVNDLLSASGLIADDEFGDIFNAITRSKDTESENLDRQFQADKLDELANQCRGAINLCENTALAEYLKDILPDRYMHLPEQTAIVTTRNILKRILERLDDDLDIPEQERPNDIFGADCRALANSLQKALGTITRHDLPAQINAGLRKKHQTRAVRSINTELGIANFGYAGLIEQLVLLAQVSDETAQFERSQVIANRVADNQLNSLLFGLADIFLHITNSGKDSMSLKAPFVNFAMEILQPFINDNELSPEALNKRWQRLRKDYKDAA